MWDFDKKAIKDITGFDSDNATKDDVIRNMTKTVMNQFGISNILKFAEMLKLKFPRLDDNTAHFLAIQALFEFFIAQCKCILDKFHEQVEDIEAINEVKRKSFDVDFNQNQD